MQTVIWRKACADHGNCAEINEVQTVIYVRDSANIGPILTFDRDVFAAFLRTIR